MKHILTLGLGLLVTFGLPMMADASIVDCTVIAPPGVPQLLTIGIPEVRVVKDNHCGFGNGVADGSLPTITCDHTFPSYVHGGIWCGPKIAPNASLTCSWLGTGIGVTTTFFLAFDADWDGDITPADGAAYELPTPGLGYTITNGATWQHVIGYPAHLTSGPDFLAYTELGCS
ncbi:MAG TPA: hypothetical protein VGR28_02790 [Candidatus Thermoplasmatota archaeon]|jgi:hypothetical protein|nr:hypothetical protein [Candidatus Thermoplasmatota archaeon]